MNQRIQHQGSQLSTCILVVRVSWSGLLFYQIIDSYIYGNTESFTVPLLYHGRNSKQSMFSQIQQTTQLQKWTFNNFIIRLNKIHPQNMLSATPQQQPSFSPPSKPQAAVSAVKATKQVLEAIYGSRVARISKQLTPLNTSTEKKTNKSTDYYSFQRAVAMKKGLSSDNAQSETNVGTTDVETNGDNKNSSGDYSKTNGGYQTQKPTYNYRKTFSGSRKSAAQVQIYAQVMAHMSNYPIYNNKSKPGLIDFSKFSPSSPQATENKSEIHAKNYQTTVLNPARMPSTTNMRSSFYLYKQKGTPLIQPATRSPMAKRQPVQQSKQQFKIKQQPQACPERPLSQRRSNSIMNSTATGFNRNPASLSPSQSSTTPMNPLKKQTQCYTPLSLGLPGSPQKQSQTATNFRPPTSSSNPNNYFRQCNNEAEDHHNYLNRYEIVKELGKGTYGVVHLAKKKKDKPKVHPDRVNGDDDLLVECGKAHSIDVDKKRSKEKDRRHSPHDQESEVAEKTTNLSQIMIQVESEIKQTILPPIRNNESPSLNLPQNSEVSQSICQSQSGEVVSQSQPLFAIKIYQKFKMNKDPTKFKNIRKQITIMQNISHPHIIKLYQSVETLTKINIVVEYGGKHSLLDYLKLHFPLSEPTMRKIAQQLLSALAYLHEKNIVHRDIKLQNILIGEGGIKIIDFGFATLTFRNRKLNAICGTPNYMAPEILSKKEYIGELADIWSFGVVIFTLGEGRHPFKAETYNELERQVNKAIYQFKRITNPIHQAFIKRILKVKPQDRPRAIDLLSHPWLQINDDTVSAQEGEGVNASEK